MDQNDAYLQALGIPQWVPREVAELDEGEPLSDSATQSEAASNDANDKIVDHVVVDVVEQSATKAPELEPSDSANVRVKALVNNPDAKFVIVVSGDLSRADLQLFWKQIKFAWQRWHEDAKEQNKKFPASLFQLDSTSDYSLQNIQQQGVLLIGDSDIVQQEASLQLPKAGDKKALWQLLQTISEKIELL